MPQNHVVTVGKTSNVDRILGTYCTTSEKGYATFALDKWNVCKILFCVIASLQQNQMHFLAPLNYIKFCKLCMSCAVNLLSPCGFVFSSACLARFGVHGLIDRCVLLIPGGQTPCARCVIRPDWGR